MKQAFSVFVLAIFTSVAVFAQTVEIVPGDNLVIDGIPKIPAALAETVGRYTEFRTAAFLDWHPAKRAMLVRTRFADTAQVHLVDFPGGARKQLTFFPDSVGANVTFQPTHGDYFVLNKDTGGNEFYQNYRYDLRTGNLTLLTDGKSRNEGAVWSPSGKLFAYTSTRRNGKDSDIYVVDPADRQTDRLIAQVDSGGWSIEDWSPDDRQLILGEYLSINETYLWLLDVASGMKSLITLKGGPDKVAYHAAKFSKDGKAAYVTTDRESEFQRLARIELATKERTYLTSHLKWDVEEFALSPDGKLLAFVTNEDGAGVLRLLDTKSGKEKPAPKSSRPFGLPLGLITGVKWHANSNDLAFNLEAARSASDVFSLDAKTAQVTRWTFSETGGLVTDSFSQPELVRWKSFDDRMISGFLYRPPSKFTGKRPVVINIHGGPESQFRPRFLGRLNYYLNELGVAIIFPNVRGSSGYGKTFVTLDNGSKREDSYKDINALLDWIPSRPELDAERVMVTGGSYGGFMTLAVATNYNDRIRCSLDVVGISNLVTFLERTESYRRDLRRAEYGDERDPKMRAFMERTAPLNNAGKIGKPIFIVQGKNDPRVPYTEAEQMVAAVKKNGVACWYLLAKDEGHGFAKKKNADFQFYATVLFMREFLLK